MRQSTLCLMSPKESNRPGLSRARDRGFFRPGGVLSREAEHAILRFLEQINEGQLDASGTFFGSALFSVKLTKLRRHWRGHLDEAALVRAVEGSVRLRLGLLRRARRDAALRHPERVFGTFCSETRVRVSDDILEIDLDLEAAAQHGKQRVDEASSAAHSGGPKSS